MENKIVSGQYLHEFGHEMYCLAVDMDLTFKAIAQHIKNHAVESHPQFVLCLNGFKGQQKFLLKFQTIEGALYLQHYSLDKRPLNPLLRENLSVALALNPNHFEDLSNVRFQNPTLDLSVNPSLGGWIKDDVLPNTALQLQDAFQKLQKPFTLMDNERELSVKKNQRNVFDGLQKHSFYSRTTEKKEALDLTAIRPTKGRKIP